MTTRLHVVRTRYPHWGSYSGIHQYLKYLSGDDFAITEQIVSDSDEDFPLPQTSVRTWLRTFVRARGMPWYKLSDLTAEIKLLKRCCSQRPEIIHYLDGEHSAQFLPKLTTLLGPVRPNIMATYHQPPDMLSRLVRTDVLRCLDGITVVAPEQAAYFGELLGTDKVHMVLHGVDTRFFRPSLEPKEVGTFRCLTVGHYQRDYNVLWRVAHLLQEQRAIEFHIVSSHMPALWALPNITVYRGLDDGSLLNLYQRSHILFLPLLQSTANNALLEALACGLPVVSTSLPAVKVYVPGNEAMLIKDNDPQQFADVILRLAAAPAECEAMAKAARKRAEELDWRRIARQYAAIYADLAKR